MAQIPSVKGQRVATISLQRKFSLLWGWGQSWRTSGHPKCFPGCIFISPSCLVHAVLGRSFDSRIKTLCRTKNRAFRAKHIWAQTSVLLFSGCDTLDLVDSLSEVWFAHLLNKIASHSLRHCHSVIERVKPLLSLVTLQKE